MGDSGEDEFEGDSDGEMDYEDAYDDSEVAAQLMAALESKSDYKKFRCIDADEASKRMEEISERTSVVVQLPQGICRVLLCKYNWNYEKLISEYGTMNIGAFLSKNDLGAIADMLASLPTQLEVEEDGGQLVDCPVCFDTISSENTASSECGHKICLDCWGDHIRQKVEKEDAGFMIRCPVCPYIISNRLILEIISDEAFHNKLKSSQTSSFVETSSLAKWCPGTTCPGNILIVESSSWGPGPVTCNKCSCEFCFGCQKVWHAPLLCSLVDVWHKEVNESNQTMDWIRGNSKPCPKCGVQIEKNGGCNAMSCSQKSCGYQFCWICLGPAHQHNYEETCSKITPEALEEMKKNRAEAKKNVEYFVFHSDRYFAHMRSLNFEKNLPETAEEVMRKAHLTYGTRILNVDTQGIQNAVKTLHRCRRMLAYAYAFSYFVEEGHEVTIFQNHLNDLHVNTEKLSFLLERELESSLKGSPQKFEKTRIDIVNKAKFCDGRRLKVVSHVMENYESGVWKMSGITETKASSQ